MTSFDKVKATGFHPDLVEKTVTRINGGKEPDHMLYHLETSFDDDSVFRHLDYLGLSDGRLIAFHLDEVSSGVGWATNIIPLHNVDSVEVAQVLGGEHYGVDDLNDSMTLEPHLLVQILFSTRLSADLEKMDCDDPECDFDHGYFGSLKHEGLAMRFFETDTTGISSTADEAMDFVGALSDAMSKS